MELHRGDESLGRLLEVYLLGLVPYEDVLRLQRRLIYDVSGTDSRLAALILCEHPPVITVGRLGSRAHIDCDDEELKARRIPVRWINRGGGCNLHVPGQLVAYPILPFRPDAMSVRGYLSRLERCVVEVLREFSVPAITTPDHSGIWAPGGQIATIGIAISRWVTYHGVTLNVSGPLDQFRILHPDGNGALRVTTMEAQRKRPAPMAKVRECLLRRFIETFGFECRHVYSQHPLLTEVKRRPVYAGSA